MLTLMIKNAFAETVLDLIPYVDDADLDGEKPAASPESTLPTILPTI